MMRKIVKYGSSIILCVAFITMNGSQEKDNMTEVFSCKGEGVQCDSNLVSAFGSFSYDTDNINVNHLGELVEDKIETIQFPQENEKVLYSFRLPAGKEFEAGQTLTILIVSFNLNNPIPRNIFTFLSDDESGILHKEAGHGKKQFKWANFMYKIYRRFEKITPWTEIATIFSQRAITSQMVKLKTDGTIVVANKVDGQEAILTAEAPGTVKKFFAAQP